MRSTDAGLEMRPATVRAATLDEADARKEFVRERSKGVNLTPSAGPDARPLVPFVIATNPTLTPAAMATITNPAASG